MRRRMERRFIMVGFGFWEISGREEGKLHSLKKGRK
jgi:hypothetical protein